MKEALWAEVEPWHFSGFVWFLASGLRFVTVIGFVK